MIGTLQEEAMPVLCLEWANGSAHYAGVTAVLITACKQPSLVECVCWPQVSAWHQDRLWPLAV